MFIIYQTDKTEQRLSRTGLNLYDISFSSGYILKV